MMSNQSKRSISSNSMSKVLNAQQSQEQRVKAHQTQQRESQERLKKQDQEMMGQYRTYLEKQRRVAKSSLPRVQQQRMRHDQLARTEAVRHAKELEAEKKAARLALAQKRDAARHREAALMAEKRQKEQTALYEYLKGTSEFKAQQDALMLNILRRLTPYDQQAVILYGILGSEALKNITKLPPERHTTEFYNAFKSHKHLLAPIQRAELETRWNEEFQARQAETALYNQQLAVKRAHEQIEIQARKDAVQFQAQQQAELEARRKAALTPLARIAESLEQLVEWEARDRKRANRAQVKFFKAR